MRTLRFGAGGHSQSVVKAGDPRHLELLYTRALPACLAFVQNPLRVLIVGLGGGTLPRFFHSHFPQMKIEVVELDPEVVNVAREHCGFAEDARMRVFVEDGRDFIEATAGGYDFIRPGLLRRRRDPSASRYLEFLTSVRKALSPEGAVMANIWGRSSNPLYAHMLLTYRAAFEDVYIFDVPQPRHQALRRPAPPARDDAGGSDRRGPRNFPAPRVHLRPQRIHRRVPPCGSREQVRGGAVLRDGSRAALAPPRLGFRLGSQRTSM